MAHVSFRLPDMELAERFFSDFGMRAAQLTKQGLYLFGYSSRPSLVRIAHGEPGFIGIGIQAASMYDLERLAAATGSPVVSSDAPEGGWSVHLIDPDGIAVEVVAGQELADIPAPDDVGWNRIGEQGRLSVVKRLSRGPAHIHSLGHVVLWVADFRRSEQWYKQLFGFLTSDEVHAPDGKALGAFMRCDRGDMPTDHHTLLLAERKEGSRFNHAAFEVSDFDDLMTGHDHLHAQGYNSFWGVGRHIVGSQIFDYWFDPWGHQFEIWTDGDLLRRADGSNIVPVEVLRQVQWGAAFPKTG